MESGHADSFMGFIYTTCQLSHPHNGGKWNSKSLFSTITLPQNNIQIRSPNTRLLISWIYTLSCCVVHYQARWCFHYVPHTNYVYILLFTFCLRMMVGRARTNITEVLHPGNLNFALSHHRTAGGCWAITVFLFFHLPWQRGGCSGDVWVFSLPVVFTPPVTDVPAYLRISYQARCKIIVCNEYCKWYMSKQGCHIGQNMAEF